MTIELYYLTLTAVLTAVLWVPYLANAAMTRGLGIVLGGAPKDATSPLSGWAERLRHAHTNTVENLVVFTGLVLVAEAASIQTEITMLSATVFFWARLAYYFIYGVGLPVLRTVAFMVAWLAQIAFAFEILTTAVDPSVASGL